ncbi:GH92 family glycosyl hydrolase [Kitasatospora cystarginea]
MPVIVSPGTSGALGSLPSAVRPAPRARATVLLLALLAVLIPPLAAASPSAAAARAASAASNVESVNPFIGTTGSSDTEYGGMLPSTAPPFAMTRWSPMTRDNRVGRLPYHFGDPKITGFIGTHQPAIWMGDSGYVAGMPGVGPVRTAEADRGLPYSHGDERSAPDRYTVDMHPAPGQTLRAELTATSRVGVLRLTYPRNTETNFVVQATRSGITGNVHIDPAGQEISGYNPDRQDGNLGPFKAPGFKGYFVARFDTAFAGYGTAAGATRYDGQADRTDQDVVGYVRFPAGTVTVTVRIATSFISADQARANLDNEVPDGQGFDATAASTRAAWADKLDRVHIQGATADQLAIFYTAMFHALQYPSEMSEHGRYYSAYDDKVHNGVSYTGYSLWDTFRAENAFLTLFAPERVDDMATSMLQDYQQGGWLPLWKNITETNIMEGTNADSIIAEDIAKGFHGFDLDLAYRAVRKDAMTPPDDDTTLWYGDRQQGTPVEARAGLTTYLKNGWVAADHTAEAGTRTLDYSYEDWAVAQVAKATGNTADAAYFSNRSANYKKQYNAATGFMQARNLDGSWAEGAWTEGDQWVYTNDVLHDVPGLIALKGGDASYSDWLDGYFAGGHNNQTNEPSHHVPYLYDYAGRPWRTQQLVRRIAGSNYHNAPDGLSGNEDCGQMSAWYLFSAMGFYPVNPASGQYVVGSPFFDKVTLDLPGTSRPLVISSPNAPSSPYVQALSLNGRAITEPFLRHEDLTGGGELDFTMNTAPQAWSATTTPPPPSVDLALDRPVRMINGNPAANWGKPTENAVDGDPSTMAQSTGSAPWSLQVDLGATTTLGRAVVNPDWENYPVSYDVEVSTGGTDWTTVASEASSGGTTGCAEHGVTTCGQIHTYTFAPTRARYVRLSVNSWVSARTGAPADGYGWGLREFEVYAPTAAGRGGTGTSVGRR